MTWPLFISGIVLLTKGWGVGLLLVFFGALGIGVLHFPARCCCCRTATPVGGVIISAVRGLINDCRSADHEDDEKLELLEEGRGSSASYGATS